MNSLKHSTSKRTKFEKPLIQTNDAYVRSSITVSKESLLLFDPISPCIFEITLPNPPESYVIIKFELAELGGRAKSDHELDSSTLQNASQNYLASNKSSLMASPTQKDKKALDFETVLKFTPQNIRFDQSNYSVPQAVRVQFTPEFIASNIQSKELVFPQNAKINCVLLSGDQNYENTYAPLEIMVLDTFGRHLTSAGSDDFCQLGKDESRYRYTAYQKYSVINLTRPMQVFQSKFEPTYISLEKVNISKKKVIDEVLSSIDIGSQHMLACTLYSGTLFSWGTGLFGQLGLTPAEIVNVQAPPQPEPTDPFAKKNQEEPVFKEKEFNFNRKLQDAEGNTFFTAGSFYPVVFVPTQVDLRLKVIQVACGDYHSLVLSSQGNIYSFGCHENGRLGAGENHKYNFVKPQQVETFKEIFFVKIACSRHASFASDVNGVMYSWGKGEGGVLGNGGEFDVWNPSPIQSISNIYSIAAGPDNVGCIDADGNGYLWGENSHRFLYSNDRCVLRPRIIDYFEGYRSKRLVKLAIGGSHFGFVTDDLEVFMWGDNTYGQVGAGVEFKAIQHPINLLAFNGSGVCDLSLGKNHSVALSIKGLTFVWGRNDKGQLGLGSFSKENVVFLEVAKPDQKPYKEICLKYPKIVESLIAIPSTRAVAKGDVTYVFSLDRNPEEKSPDFADYKQSLLKKEKDLSRQYMVEMWKALRYDPCYQVRRDSNTGNKQDSYGFELNVPKIATKSDLLGTINSKADIAKSSRFNLVSFPTQRERERDMLTMSSYVPIGKESPLLQQFVGQRAVSTVFEHRDVVRQRNQVEKKENTNVEEIQINYEKNELLQGIPDEVLMANFEKYSNQTIFESKVSQSNPLTRLKMLYFDIFDDVKRFTLPISIKNPLTLE